MVKRKIRWFGLDRKYSERTGRSRWDQDIVESGYKMHMNNLNAAIGVEQMKKVDFIVNSHIKNGEYYDKNINNPKIEKLRRLKNCSSSFWIYSILVEDKKKFEKYMKDNGIATDVVHVRNDRYSVFENFRDNSLKNLDYFSDRLMNIPVGWWLTDEQVEYITDVVNRY